MANNPRRSRRSRRGGRPSSPAAAQPTPQQKKPHQRPRPATGSMPGRGKAHGNTSPAHAAAPVPSNHLAGPPQEGERVQGVLELHPKGYGFLRSPARSYAAGPQDPYVPGPLIQKYSLKEGLLLAGPLEGGRHSQAQGPRLLRIDQIEGAPPEELRRRNFDDLTPVDPTEQVVLETGQEPLTTRVMDMLTPIGKGQRGLIVAPPRTGKTILLQHIAQAVARNHPEMHLIMLLIDERPEEVTEMRRLFRDRGTAEVIASSSDQDATSHARTAELVLERAKRLAEHGKQVFVLLDSLTRLARAYNRNVGNSGRTMSGGVDIRALEIPKRLFGQARAFEEGGSLTIMGTALIDTGSRMDELIFQEFKGTGNMELVLDRRLADRRVYPAIDVGQSGTRKEERLLSPEVLQRVTLLRRSMVKISAVSGMETLVKKLGEYPSNAAFLDRIALFSR
jgi:transcription termination factor Rho